jgi:hypothetical protein
MMYQRQLRSFALALVVLVCFGCIGAGAQEKSAASATEAHGKKEVVKETAKTRKSGSEDTNIKNDSDKNQPDTQRVPPANKGGKSRGSGPLACGVHVDNRTPWLIRVFVDGTYVGTVNQYGDLSGITGNGATAVYAVALFDNGSERYWGPHLFNCSAGDIYTWRLGQ